MFCFIELSMNTLFQKPQDFDSINSNELLSLRTIASKESFSLWIKIKLACHYKFIIGIIRKGGCPIDQTSSIIHLFL